jgi:hypothetical protein
LRIGNHSRKWFNERRKNGSIDPTESSNIGVQTYLEGSLESMALQEINKLEDIWDRNIENSNKVGSYIDIILETC